MASAIHKITLSSSRDIPFNKLVLSQANVRRVKAGVSVEELAESIARRGLIQSDERQPSWPRIAAPEMLPKIAPLPH
jgi:ParB family transcriptional regulator, chromosome partitioning protein